MSSGRNKWKPQRVFLGELSTQTRLQPPKATGLCTRRGSVRSIDPNGKSRSCEYSTKTLRQDNCSKLHTVHHRVLLCIIGAQRKQPDHRMDSYNSALEIPRGESVETTLRTVRLLRAGSLIRMSGRRLPKRSIAGDVEGAMRRMNGSIVYRATL